MEIPPQAADWRRPVVRVIPPKGVPLAPAAAANQNARVKSRWLYNPSNGRSMALRWGPSIECERTGTGLSPGDEFDVIEERVWDGIICLKLSDRIGWALDQKPEKAIMCERVKSIVN